MTDRISLIPAPTKMIRMDGYFHLDQTTNLISNPAFQTEARYLQVLLEAQTGLSLPILTEQAAGTTSIRLSIAPQFTDTHEGYSLYIHPDGIEISAGNSAGIFHGIQSLRQLIALNKSTIISLPCLEIEDSPRFSWRGFMLDVGRHFHGKEQVLRLLDIMALFKMNIFHWHLTEDQGWRIEIQQYPKLTEIGAKRAGTLRKFIGSRHDGIPHCGYYTQQDIRDILAYAAIHHIIVVPEIEIPGHSLAALASYPEFSCTGGPFTVATKPGIYADIYCVGKEKTFEFLQNVLDEVISLFPGKFIHIGGDETPKKRWTNCPDCQRRASEQGVKPEQLQVYFTNRMAAYLHRQDKRVIGWSEILQPGLAPNAIVQYWLPKPKTIIKAIRSGREVIVSPLLQLYLDHSYALTSLQRAYQYEPIFNALNPENQHNIIGLEAPLWSECVWNSDRLDYQVFPRLLAYAETGWSQPAHKDYTDFELRVTAILPLLEHLGIHYAPPSDWNPPAWKQKLGIFTILQDQAKTANRV